MAIMGGAILPKLMGAVADKYDLSRGFIVPLLCFLVRRSLWLLVASTQWSRSHARSVGYRRALGYERCI